MSASDWLGFVALILATIAGTAFMIVYSWVGPWWKPDPTDRHGEARAHLGYFTLALTLTFWLYDFRPLIDHDLFGWIRSSLFFVIALCMVWRFWLLIHGLRRRKRIRPAAADVR